MDHIIYFVKEDKNTTSANLYIWLSSVQALNAKYCLYHVGIPLEVLREYIAPKSSGLHSSRFLDIQVQCNLRYALDSPHLRE